MNSRLEALISRGYDREEVISLGTFTEDELEYASKCAFRHISKNCIPVENPNAIFIGGQPGCGKTIMSMSLKNEIKNAVEIGIDNYRMYHPRYLEIEECIKEHWKNRVETINDTPGNDIADFTHFFAGAMTDKLIELGKNNRYSLLLEWSMREPKEPLDCMRELNKNGYNNVVLFVSTYKDISYEACNLRYNVMKNNKHIIRKVPKSFHDFCVETLPNSVNEIYKKGYLEDIIDYMALITRNNKIIWDNESKEMPGEVYNNCLNNINYINNKENNSILANLTNKKELEGLKNSNEKVIIADPHFLNMNTKVK